MMECKLHLSCIMKKIMIVDDDPLVLLGLKKYLRKFCDEVKHAAYGSVALSGIGSCHYDLCFLDINLPDANGLDIMDRILAISPETKIVIMTAGHVEEEARRRISKSAHFFITKPFELENIEAIVHQALHGGGTEPSI